MDTVTTVITGAVFLGAALLFTLVVVVLKGREEAAKQNAIDQAEWQAALDVLEGREPDGDLIDFSASLGLDYKDEVNFSDYIAVCTSSSRRPTA